MSRARTGGRVLPHERETDDAPIIGADIVINKEHAAAVQATKQKEKKEKTRKEYRGRLGHLIDFFAHKYRAYFDEGTYLLSEDQKNDPSKYYFFKNKNGEIKWFHRDLRYRGLNVSLVLAYLSSKKIKANGKFISWSDLSKYGDAIKWGAKIAGERLPESFYVEMDGFIAAYKKEHTEAKKNGQVDEKASDPVNASLFTLILKWALESMNIFVWVFSLLMWHLMARSISVSSLGLHNIKRGTA